MIQMSIVSQQEQANGMTDSCYSRKANEDPFSFKEMLVA